MKESDFDNSRLERVKQDLEGTPEDMLPRPLGGVLTPHDVSVQTDWSTVAVSPTKKKSRAEVSAFKFALFSIILMFIGSIGFLIYKVLDDPNAKPSDKNIGLRVDGPVSVAAGEPLEFAVDVSNKNRIPLAYANITITYPDGTQYASDITKPLKEEKKLLGEVTAGTDATYKARAVFLGEEKAEKTVRISLEYRIDGVNSALTKELDYVVHLSASPLNIVVDSLKEVSSGKEIELNITMNANTRETLDNVLLKLDTPFGFTYTDASMKPAFQNSVWTLGSIAPGTKKTLTIRGTLAGEDGQEKVFRVYAGTQGKQEYDIGSVYGSLLTSVTIKKPFLSVGLLIDGDDKDTHVAPFGSQLNATINWKNNLLSRVTDAEIQVTLRGTPLDRRAIVPKDEGYYRSADDTITWDERQTTELAEINSGEGGEVHFGFAPLPALTADKLLRNPEITLDVTIRGKRTSESGVPEQINTIISKKIHFTTDVKFSGRVVYGLPPFQNTGPIPPVVGQETTYTVIWSLVDTSNDLDNVTVTSRLPSYVKWMKNVDPQSEELLYDDARGTLSWNIGHVTAGTGIVNPAKQVSFQVSFTPSLSDSGKSPDLILDSIFNGTDTYTNVPIQKKVNKMNTSLPTDPTVPREGGTVKE